MSSVDVEVLPPGSSLARMAETTDLDQAHDPARAAVDVLDAARVLLDHASRDEDIDRLIELKDGAQLIREWSAQKKMGLDLELAAAEFVRRTERAIAKAIRAGQTNGQIRKRGEHQGNQHSGYRLDTSLPSATTLIPSSDERGAIFVFADEATDEEFEEALAEAKAEGNLSRANVKRKVKKEPAKPSKRPEHLRGTRHIDPNRVMNATVDSALVDDTTFELLEGRYAELDRDRIEGWVRSLTEAINALSRLRNQLKKEQTQ